MPAPEMVSVVAPNGQRTKVPAASLAAGAFVGYTLDHDDAAVTPAARAGSEPPAQTASPLPDTYTSHHPERIGDGPAPTTKKKGSSR